MDTLIRDEVPQDAQAVVDLIAVAFRTEPQVAVLWRDLRGLPGTVSLVAEADGQLVGHVGLTVGWVDAIDRLVPVHVLSPLSVHPDHQGHGLGGRLVEAARERTHSLGSPALFLEGDPGYYGRHGFQPAEPHRFRAPSVRIPGPAFQVVLLPAYDASVAGALVYADAFWRHDAVGLRGADLERFGGTSTG